MPKIKDFNAEVKIETKSSPNLKKPKMINKKQATVGYIYHVLKYAKPANFSYDKVQYEKLLPAYENFLKDKLKEDPNYIEPSFDALIKKDGNQYLRDEYKKNNKPEKKPKGKGKEEAKISSGPKSEPKSETKSKAKSDVKSEADVLIVKSKSKSKKKREVKAKKKKIGKKSDQPSSEQEVVINTRGPVAENISRNQDKVKQALIPDIPISGPKSNQPPPSSSSIYSNVAADVGRQIDRQVFLSDKLSTSIRNGDVVGVDQIQRDNTVGRAYKLGGFFLGRTELLGGKEFRTTEFEHHAAGANPLSGMPNFFREKPESLSSNYGKGPPLPPPTSIPLIRPASIGVKKIGGGPPSTQNPVPYGWPHSMGGAPSSGAPPSSGASFMTAEDIVAGQPGDDLPENISPESLYLGGLLRQQNNILKRSLLEQRANRSIKNPYEPKDILFSDWNKIVNNRAEEALQLLVDSAQRDCDITDLGQKNRIYNRNQLFKEMYFTKLVPNKKLSV